jgi:hypothetical protein
LAHGCGSGGSGSGSNDHARWGGMSKDEWLAQKQKRDQEKKAEEALAGAKTAKAAPTPPSLPGATAKKSPSPPQRQEGFESPPEGDDAPVVKKPVKPALPKNFAEWKADDYRNAAREGFPRLAEAVRYLGERSKGQEEAAKTLITLIEASATDADQEGGAVEEGDDQSPRRLNPNTANAIIGAFLDNDTPPARQMLEKIVAGTANTFDDQLLATAALKVMMARPSAENNELLLRILVAPPAAGRQSQTAFDPEVIRKTTLATIKTASESLRVRLAERMVAPETPPAVYDQLWTCLREPRPENLAAQIILYRSDLPDQATRQQMEKWFAAESSRSLGGLLGLREIGQYASASGRTAADLEPRRAAQLFWNPALASSMEHRLWKLEELREGADVVMLAATIPTPSLRSVLLRTMERCWEEGPKSLKALTKAEGLVAEPGFLLAMKKLPRKNAAGTKLTKGMPAQGSGGDQMKAKQQQQQTAEEWLAFSRDIVLAACKRFCSAAKPETSADADRLPFKPPAKAEMVAIYRLNWPEDLGDAAAGAPTLRVFYARLYQKTTPLRAVAYYRRQMPNCQEHLYPDGCWLESFVEDKQPGLAQSVDVLVRKTNSGPGGAGGLPNQEQELMVDILGIQCAEEASSAPVAAAD